MHQIFVLSGGSGRTGEQFLAAALAQFPKAKVKVSVRPRVRSRRQVLEVVKEAAEADGFIVFTIVSAGLREDILELGQAHGVETIDLMGRLLAHLSELFSDVPTGKPGLFHELNKDYFQRMEAMNFAFHHDDGQRASELTKADIVLVGVSRTFKTPLSMYLAFEGWMVGNVPIVPGIEPPSMLFKLAAGRVFGLTTNANRLAAIRKGRAQDLPGGAGDYAKVEQVRAELMYAQSIFARAPKWHVVDVTNKPIEEIASEILSVRSKSKPRKRKPGASG